MDDCNDLTGELPALVQGDTLDLAELGGSGAELSTGLILTWREKLVFALVPDALPLGGQGQQGVLAFVGVGGHLDPGESWVQAVVREAMEEASCPIGLGDSAVTYLCREGQTPRPIAYRWTEAYRPLLVWVATFMLRRGPECRRVPTTLVNAVFRAAALERPSPGAEVAGLLVLDQETLLHSLAAPRPVGDLLTHGAQVLGRPLPADTLVAPGGSAYFYAQWLAWQECNG
jgi:hypothetical protein